MEPGHSEQTPEARLRFLLQFLERDLSTLREGERIDLEADVVKYFKDPAMPVDEPPPDGWSPSLKRDVLPATSNLSDLQSALRQGVERLGVVGWTWHPSLSPAPRTERHGDGTSVVRHSLLPPPSTRRSFERRADGTVALRHSGPLDAVLLFSAADVLVTGWPKLRRCEWEPCNRLFLPEHGHQRYHDAKCSGKMRQERLASEKKKGTRNYQQEKANAVRREELKTKKRRTLGKGKK